MINSLLNFFHMGGYANYVWISYGTVSFFLLMQWLIPWRRWQKFLRTLKK